MKDSRRLEAGVRSWGSSGKEVARTGDKSIEEGKEDEEKEMTYKEPHNEC